MASEVERLRAWLAKADYEAIIAYAREHQRVLSSLTALTYDNDASLAWRAVETIGLAASQIAQFDPEYVRTHLQRLFWLLTDESGGIGWRAAEAIGEILYHCPDQFGEFIPILVNLIDMEPEDAIRFRAGWLWAMGRLAAVRPAQARAALSWILPCLDDPDPQVRGSAIWCLGQMEYQPSPETLATIKSDYGQVRLYLDQAERVLMIAELLDFFDG